MNRLKKPVLGQGDIKKGVENMAKVKIPQPLRNLTGGNNEVSLTGSKVGEVLSELEKEYPSIKERLRDDEGKLRRFINIFVNGDDIRHLEGEATPVSDSDEITILPAIAGG